MNTSATNPNDPETVFVMHLLMENPCPMPSKKRLNTVMQRHIETADCYSCTKEAASFAVPKYTSKTPEGEIPAALMLTACAPCGDWKPAELEISQMWECPEHDEILSKCRYHVLAADMLADKLPYAQRAELVMDYLEALLELYPSCKAVYFETSGKLLTREKILNTELSREDRFIFFAVNIRFFNTKDGNMLVDSLGMKFLGLPDVQYQFLELDPNDVVGHAYNVLSFLYAGGTVLDNDTFDGIRNGELDESIQWRCWYDDAHISPLREVIDIRTEED